MHPSLCSSLTLTFSENPSYHYTHVFRLFFFQLTCLIRMKSRWILITTLIIKCLAIKCGKQPFFMSAYDSLMVSLDVIFLYPMVFSNIWFQRQYGRHCIFVLDAFAIDGEASNHHVTKRSFSVAAV